MAVTHDASTQAAALSTASTQNTTHTPVGVPKGVLVRIAQDLGTEDQISGVTYGGVAMTRVLKADRPAATLGCVYLYFLGSGIPTGAQTVAITSTGTRVKRAVISTQTAAGNTQVNVSNSGNGSTANPSLSLAAASGPDMAAYYVLQHDANAPATTPQAGSTHEFGHDFGSESAMWSLKELNSGGATTMGYTIAAGTWVHAGAAIEEVPSDVIESGTNAQGIVETATAAVANAGTDTEAISENTTAAVAGSATDTEAIVETATAAVAASATDTEAISESTSAALAASGTDTAVIADSGTFPSDVVESGTSLLAVSETGDAAMGDTATGVALISQQGEAAMAGAGTDTDSISEAASSAAIANAGGDVAAISQQGEAAAAGAGTDSAAVSDSASASIAVSAAEALALLDSSGSAIAGAGTDLLVLADSGSFPGDVVSSGVSTFAISDAGAAALATDAQAAPAVPNCDHKTVQEAMMLIQAAGFTYASLGVYAPSWEGYPSGSYEEHEVFSATRRAGNDFGIDINITCSESEGTELAFGPSGGDWEAEVIGGVWVLTGDEAPSWAQPPPPPSPSSVRAMALIESTIAGVSDSGSTVLALVDSGAHAIEEPPEEPPEAESGMAGRYPSVESRTTRAYPSPLTGTGGWGESLPPNRLVD